MTSVDRVKAICKERNIPLYKLERDCGFGNSYIRQLRKGMFPVDRLVKIADYLGVTAEYIMTGQQKAPTTQGEQKDIEPIFTYAMNSEVDKLTPERKKMLRDMARFLIEQQEKESRDNG